LLRLRTVQRVFIRWLFVVRHKLWRMLVVQCRRLCHLGRVFVVPIEFHAVACHDVARSWGYESAAGRLIDIDRAVRIDDARPSDRATRDAGRFFGIGPNLRPRNDGRPDRTECSRAFRFAFGRVLSRSDFQRGRYYRAAKDPGHPAPSQRPAIESPAECPS